MPSGHRLSELIHLTCFCTCIRHIFCTGRHIILPSPTPTESSNVVSGCTKSHVRIFSSFTAQAFFGLGPLLTVLGARICKGGHYLSRSFMCQHVWLAAPPSSDPDGSTESHLKHVAGPLIVTLRLA